VTGAPLSHASASELLPWLVNGRLAAAERDAVEAHARDCLVCRRELKEQRQLAALLRSAPATDVPLESGFGALERRLDEPRRQPRWSATEWFPRPLDALRIGAAAAFLIVLIGSAMWLSPSRDTPAPYSTLAAAPGAGTAQLDVVFANDTTAQDMRELLDAVGGEIVAGPSDVGRYGIRIGGGTADAAEVARVLERLKHDDRVRFAGRAFAATGP
jgi:hypothetical protein